MPKFICEVHEEVHATIEVEVIARSKKQAAQLAREAWVNNAKGEMSEAVEDRWVEVDGEVIETKED
jgi:hypothetical protein